jgi:hypothetical protein
MNRKPLNLPVTLCAACLIAASLLLTGCSTIKVVETWNSPKPVAKRYHKLLIVAIAHDENLRGMAENIMVDELRRNGVTAVASHTLVKEMDNAKRDDIIAAVRSVNADGVISIRAISRGVKDISQNGQTEGIYGTVTNVGGSPLPGARDYSLATLQSSLYDSATAELVWSATIKTFDAYDVAEVSRDLAKFYLKELRLKGFI